MQTLRNLGPTRLAVMGGVVMGLFGFFIFLVTRLGSPQMTLLYSDLPMQDSGRVVAQLESMNIPYELKRGGSQVNVPGDQMMRLRITMAEQGIPSGGIIGYEIFDKTGVLGTTDFMQNVNLVRALEGELARTIQTIEGVHRARVHLVMPRRELFSREKQEPSASIVLNMQGGARLSSEQVSAVQHLVAASVPSLSPNSIAIVDEKGKLLAAGFEDGDSIGTMAAKAAERRRNFENSMARTIEDLLERSVGFGNVRAEVSAEMDFDRITTNAESYNPDGQVVRSTHTIEENLAAKESDSNPPVSVASNLPDAGSEGGESAASATNEARTEETVNFEISRTVTNTVREAGLLKRLSVAVLIDGTNKADEEGEHVYTPRGKEEMEQMAALVRTAIGFDADRGDAIEVINMQFQEGTDDVIEEEPLELFFGFGKNELLRIAEILVLSIVAVLVILLVVRPLITRAMEALPAAGAAAREGRLLADGTVAPALAGPAPMPGEGMPGDDDLDEMIDLERVEGRVKASSVKKVGEIVEKHPEEALSIVRSWMYQEN